MQLKVIILKENGYDMWIVHERNWELFKLYTPTHQNYKRNRNYLQNIGSYPNFKITKKQLLKYGIYKSQQEP